MAERLVHELEAVEIDHARRDQPLGPARAADRRAQAVQQERTVGQAGEAVVQRLVAQRVLGPPLLGDVVEREHRAAQLAVLPDDRLAPGPPVTQLPIRADDRVLEPAHDLAAQEPGDRRVVTGNLRDAVALDADAASDPVVRALALTRAPVIALEDAIPEHDRTRGIGGDDAGVRVVDDGTQEREVTVAVSGGTGVHPAHIGT